MTKRINFALAETPPAAPPVVATLSLDRFGDINIVLTKGGMSLHLGYLCSETGTLILYDLTEPIAVEFGLQLDTTTHKIKVA